MIKENTLYSSSLNVSVMMKHYTAHGFVCNDEALTLSSSS